MAHLSPSLAHSHWVPAAIFLATYFLIAIESGRGSHLDRTAAAFCGAVAMVLAGVVSLDDAYKVIDWNTILFLLGMMILVAHFQVAGFFDWVAVHVALVARSRFQLLALLVFTSGILSAFFVNDTICLILTPIVLRCHRPPENSACALPDRGCHVLEYRLGDVCYRQSAKCPGGRFPRIFHSSAFWALSSCALFGLASTLASRVYFSGGDFLHQSLGKPPESALPPRR